MRRDPVQAVQRLVEIDRIEWFCYLAGLEDASGGRLADLSEASDAWRREFLTVQEQGDAWRRAHHR